MMRTASVSWYMSVHGGCKDGRRRSLRMGTARRARAQRSVRALANQVTPLDGVQPLTLLEDGHHRSES